jgi:polyisoprenoid-binding protein YceI
MKLIQSLLLIAAIVIALPDRAKAAEYAIDSDHTNIVFKVEHLGISSVTGRFERFSGSLHFDGNDVKKTRAIATIDASSINTGVEKRDDHLRSADFFNAVKFPHVKFASTGVKNVQEGKFQLTGDLTIRDVTRSIVLDAELGGAAKDPWGNQRVAIAATATINRKDFGLGWNQVLETGGLLVGEKIDIELEIEGVLQQDKK